MLFGRPSSSRNRQPSRSSSPRRKPRRLLLEQLGSRALMTGDLDFDEYGEPVEYETAEVPAIQAATTTTMLRVPDFAKGLQAVHLSVWSQQSVDNFLGVAKGENVPGLEIGFVPKFHQVKGQAYNPDLKATNPSTPDNDPYFNAKRVAGELVSAGKRVRFVVHFGFQDESLDHLTGSTGRTQEFVKLFLNDEIVVNGQVVKVKDVPQVRIVLTPSLEDKFDKYAEFEDGIRMMAANMDSASLSRISFRRSAIHDYPDLKDNYDDDVPTNRTISGVRAMGSSDSLTLRIAHEYHGYRGDAAGFNVFSNDGVFVYSSTNLDKTRPRIDESDITPNANPKDTDKVTIGAFTKSTNELIKSNPRTKQTTLLWRPAYNLLRNSGSSDGYDIKEWYTAKNTDSTRDRNTQAGDADHRSDPTVAFDDLEVAVLKKFLRNPIQRPNQSAAGDVRARSAIARWEATSDEPEAYRVSASTDGLTWQALGVTSSTNLPVGGLTPATHYLLKVQALDGDEVSDDSNIVTVDTPDEAPASPANLRAANIWARTIDLNWDDRSGNETAFRISISRNGGATWESAGSTVANDVGFRVLNLLPGTQYLFKVQAENAAGPSLDSNVISVTTRTEAPAAPANLRAANVWARTIDLNWNDMSGNETSFRISLSRNGGATWEQAGSTAANVTGFRVVNLLPGTTYLFKTYAENAAGPSLDSNIVSVTTPSEAPVAAGNLRVANVWSRTVDLNWDDSSNNESGFIVSRSTDGVNFSEVGRTLAGAVNFRVSNLVPNRGYWFKVTAYNGAGSSDSNIIFVVTPDEPPAAPTGLRAANIWAQTIDLNWYDTSNNETGFAIQMSTNGVNFTEVGRTGANAVSFRVNGLRANTRYFFRVVAFNAIGVANSNTLDTRTRA